MHSKPTILVVSHNFPIPGKSSGDLRFFSLLLKLSQYWEIHFCIAPSRTFVAKANEERHLIISLLESYGIKVLPVSTSSFINTLKTNHYHGAYLNFYFIAAETLRFFRHYQANAFIIIDSVDVHFSRLNSQTGKGILQRYKIEKTKWSEKRIYQAADLVIAISEDDAIILKEDLGVNSYIVIPNIVPAKNRLNIKRKPVITFIGSYKWYPNISAVLWFCKDIWPLIFKSCPDAEFRIIGSNPTKEIIALNKLDGVNVIGFVPDTSKYLEDTAVSVAPLLVGGGMKGKVNEALAHGVPVVTTSIGAQGFNAVNGKEMFITDNAPTFAGYVIDLLKSHELQLRIGKAGQQLQERLGSPQVINQIIQSLINKTLTLTSKKESLCQKNLFFLHLIAGYFLPYFHLLSRIQDIGLSRLSIKIKQLLWKKTESFRKYFYVYKLSQPKIKYKFKKNTQPPTVSIIIPVFNQWLFTYNCLKSLAKHITKYSFEIIIIDDCSTDRTSDFLIQYFENIRIIKNKINIGFLHSCNAAANESEGEYLVFLNNDTIVTDGWLDELIGTFLTHKNVGLVGSKLIYPDGMLQEAGGIISSDGSAINYGNLDSAEKAEFSYVRDVDYCSGASLCIKKELWNKIGGFDSKFAPAYYEDSDLAMSVRLGGLRVLYQPHSVVVHFEGISNGKDLFSGPKQAQVKNQYLFYEKWKEILINEHYPRTESLFKVKERNFERKTILLIDELNFDDNKAIEKVDFFLDTYSSFQYILKYLHLNPKISQVLKIYLEKKGIEVIYGNNYKIKKWIKNYGKQIDGFVYKSKKINGNLEYKYLKP